MPSRIEFFARHKVPAGLAATIGTLLSGSVLEVQTHHPNVRADEAKTIVAASVGKPVVLENFPNLPVGVIPSTTTTTAPPETTTTTTPPAPKPVLTTTTTVPITRPQAAGTTESNSGQDLGTFKVTCYDLRGHTATGDEAGPQSVAVDPSVIPYGTHVWIDGVGERVADDTGGAIQGHHIDIWESSQAACDQWGIKYRDVRKL